MSSFLPSPPKIQWDGTINVPTLLVLIGMCCTGVVSVASIYSNLDKRIDHNASDIRAVEQAGVTNTETIKQVRSDTKDQLSEINYKLDSILLNQSKRP